MKTDHSSFNRFTDLVFTESEAKQCAMDFEDEIAAENRLFWRMFLGAMGTGFVLTACIGVAGIWLLS